MPDKTAILASLMALAALSLAGGAVAQAKRPGFTAEQAKRGAELYSGTCAVCHGERLDDGEFAPALKGPGFAAYWNGKTAEDVSTYIYSMMPPTQPGALGAQGNADVLAFIMQAGGAPAGDKELPTDPTALKGLAVAP